MKKSPTTITVFVKKEDAKSFHGAMLAKEAVFVEKFPAKYEGVKGYNITYTVPTLCKEGAISVLKKFGFSISEAKAAYPGLFSLVKKTEAEDDEDDDEEDDEDEDEDKKSEDSPIDNPDYMGDEDDKDDPAGLKGAGEGAKGWKDQNFGGEYSLPPMQKRSPKSDSIVVKASETFRVPGTNHIITKGESFRIYPKKAK